MKQSIEGFTRESNQQNFQRNHKELTGEMIDLFWDLALTERDSSIQRVFARPLMETDTGNSQIPWSFTNVKAVVTDASESSITQKTIGRKLHAGVARRLGGTHAHQGRHDFEVEDSQRISLIALDREKRCLGWKQFMDSQHLESACMQAIRL